MPKLITQNDEKIADALSTFVILNSQLNDFSEELMNTAVEAGCQGNDERVIEYTIKIEEVEALRDAFQDIYTDLKIKIKESQVYSSLGSVSGVIRDCVKIVSTSYDFSKLVNNLQKLNKILNRSSDGLKKIQEALKPKSKVASRSTSLNLNQNNQKNELTDAQQKVYQRIEYRISQRTDNQTVTKPETAVSNTDNIDEIFNTIKQLKKE